jgi:hypothetical protein
MSAGAASSGISSRGRKDAPLFRAAIRKAGSYRGPEPRKRYLQDDEPD